MSSQNEFPWDTLRAETLRSIVVELGIPTARSLRKREGMVKTLTSVMENGRELVSSNDSHGRTTRLAHSERLLMPAVGSGENNRGVQGACREGTT